MKVNTNKDLSKILEIDKIQAVKNEISNAHGLPNECYVSDKYLKFERNKIFYDNWTVIGTASSIQEIGEVKTYDLLGIPLIILRDQDKNIKVFHNVCSHRGFKLIDKDCKLKNVLRCPYHSWSYNFNGQLVATPHIGGINKHQAEGFDKNKSNLKEVRSKIWMDLIFININSNAENFENSIKPLEKRWSKFINKDDQNLIRHAKDFGYFNIEVKSNWKFAIENYCESYHLPWIHPELNKISNIEDHYHIEDISGNFSGQGSNKYIQQFEGNRSFQTFPNWPSTLSQKSEYVSLFPNVMLGIHIDHFYVFWLEPLESDKTREHFEMYYVGDESAYSEEYKEIRKKNFLFWQDVMSEDITAIEGMQKGRASPAYNGGNFSPVMDTPTHMFHKWVANNLTN
jgi:choline monooxygenase